MRILRVFPRRTRATPDDGMAFVGPPDLFVPDCDEIHISVAFSWDKQTAMQLAEAWKHVAPVKIGGPGWDNTPSGDFVPGMYVKQGYVITSRGCPNRCWFCRAWRREGKLRELPICNGHNVLDDNLLACSSGHISRVFDMLQNQVGPAEFTGGLESRLITDDVAANLKRLKPKSVWMAYDERSDWEPLVSASERLFKAGFTKTSHTVMAYVLCGYPGDSLCLAEQRMRDTLRIGVTPMAMLWRDPMTGLADIEWRRFQRLWARPAIIWRLANER